jgi:hypothetical protein
MPPDGTMNRKRLPTLPETGRRYLDDTLRARLASTGVERFERRPRQGGRLVLALLVAAALVGLMLLLV